MRLKDKVCIVTGGASGLGKTFSLGLAAEGAKVAVCANSSDPTEVVDKIKSNGGDAIGIKVDVREVASTEEMAAKTKEAFGRIDVLIANAGIYGQLKPQPFETIDPDEWDWVMAVNLKGPYLSSRAVLPAMREQKKGNIIIVSSVFWLVGRLPCMHYAVTKAGEMGMMRQRAAQLANDNIRVNALLPGGTFDEATEKFVSHLGPGAAEA
ncbi:MAG: SDR family oxidoreductase, partial [Deltaproteobacteria bacterium]|nr:SDR family oxidoreductase [Deltaproteobacteria bacterium]